MAPGVVWGEDEDEVSKDPTQWISGDPDNPAAEKEVTFCGPTWRMHSQNNFTRDITLTCWYL